MTCMPLFALWTIIFEEWDKILYEPPTLLTLEYPQNYRASILHNPTKYGLNRPKGPRVREHYHLLGTFCHPRVFVKNISEIFVKNIYEIFAKFILNLLKKLIIINNIKNIHLNSPESPILDDYLIILILRNNIFRSIILNLEKCT
jgi:hypothetical protein